MKNILLFLRGIKKNILFQNLLASGFVDIINKLTPIFIHPLIISLLGIKIYGQFVFAQTVSSYIELVTNYGYTYSLPVFVAKNQQNTMVLEYYLSIVVIIKLFMFGIVVGIFYVASLFFENFDSNLIFLAALVPLGNIFQFQSFFQGIQRMKYLTYLSLFSNILLITLILSKFEKNLYTILLIFGLVQIIGGIISYSIIYNKFGVHLKLLVNKKKIIKHLRDNWYPFINLVTVPFYNSIHILFIRSMLGDEALGIYSVPEKIFNALTSFQSIINRPFLPHLSQIYNTQRTVYKERVNHYGILILCFSLMLSIILYFFGEKVLLFFNPIGSFINQQKHILNTLSFAIFAVLLSSFFQLSFIVVNQMNKTFKILLHTAIFNLIIIYPLIYSYNLMGAAFAAILSYCFLLLQFYFKYKKLQI